MRIRLIDWSAEAHATRRATVQEITDVLIDPGSTFRRNLRGRTGTHVASGRTGAGRRLTVAFIYDNGSAIPITAWEG